MSELKKRWLQMGAELEGSWTSRTRRKAAEAVRGARPHDDRSVHIGHGDPGEIVTRPHDNLENLCRDITELWPDDVNDSCGFHLHASFTPMDGSVIATREFYKFFKDEWARWGTENKIPKDHAFWTRLNGKNKFCKDLFDPEKQLKSFAGSPPDARYTMLNFFAWEKHKTIECRLLPMFSDVELALSAVRHLAQTYDRWLNEHGFQNIILESPAKVSGDTAVESYTFAMPSTTPMEYEAKGTFPYVERGDDIMYAVNDVADFRKFTKQTMP